MYKGILYSLSILILAAPLAVPAAEEAESLVQQNCVRCHGPEIYTRADRRIRSLAGLEAQVRRCESMLELKWFDEEILGVTDYLNRSYYKLAP